MSKLFLVPPLLLLLLLPFQGSFQSYLASQKCQMNQLSANSTCYCDNIQEKIGIDLDETCCCIKPDNKAKLNTNLAVEVKPIFFGLVLDLVFSITYPLSKKHNVIENYFVFYSTRLSTIKTIDYWAPPIYQQNCSLRI